MKGRDATVVRVAGEALPKVSDRSALEAVDRGWYNDPARDVIVVRTGERSVWDATVTEVEL